MSILNTFRHAFSSYPAKWHLPDEAWIRFNTKILDNIWESRGSIFSPLSEECRQKYLSVLKTIVKI